MNSKNKFYKLIRFQNTNHIPKKNKKFKWIRLLIALKGDATPPIRAMATSNVQKGNKNLNFRINFFFYQYWRSTSARARGLYVPSMRIDLCIYNIYWPIVYRFNITVELWI